MTTHDCSMMTDPASRLEQGEAIVFESSPFPLPSGSDLSFLLNQAQIKPSIKHISLDLATSRLTGFQSSEENQQSLVQILQRAARTIIDWLAAELPGYAPYWRPARVIFNPVEEALRQLPRAEREDLMHMDSEELPTEYWRVLNVQINLNPELARAQVTSDRFPELLEKYGARAGLPGQKKEGWAKRAIQSLPRLFRRESSGSELQQFFQRFHQYLRGSESFQERSIKRIHHLPPRGVWLAMTDTVSHAVLRGQYALELTLHIAPESLKHPEKSPARLVEQLCHQQMPRRAA